jgi:hypothetical protein
VVAVAASPSSRGQALPLQAPHLARSLTTTVVLSGTLLIPVVTG